MKESLLHKGQFKKNEKCNKKVKKSKGCRNRFVRAVKIRNPFKNAKVHNFHSAALFFWLGCSALQLDSSYLDLNPCPQDI